MAVSPKHAITEAAKQSEISEQTFHVAESGEF